MSKSKKTFPEYRQNTNLFYPIIIGALLILILFGYLTLRYQNSTKKNEISSSSNSIVDNDFNINNEKDIVEGVNLHPEFVISEGDTLASIFAEASINNNDSAAMVDAFSKKINPRKLSIGTSIVINFIKNSSGDLVLEGAVITISNNKEIKITRNVSGKFSALEVQVPLVKKVEYRKGIIKNSFNAAAIELSVPTNAIFGMVRAFSYDVDFQRDIKNGDKLEVLMDKFYTSNGKISHNGDVLYSSLTLKGKKISIYLYKDLMGDVAYYNDKGESIKKEFLRTPINAARISSKFGMRSHPVLGYTRMHKGVDFAAPVGTPILAAGGGVVEVARRNGQYGKYVRIKHNASYSTAYAHISRFANGIKSGSKVKQGQVIAYVGMTGVTNGPHLHYEVIEKGRHINPLKFKSASSSGKLSGKDLELFKKTKKLIDKKLS
jgi:murein DD-endopeptidase MepM/ murein hydrolase activator NlpD